MSNTPRINRARRGRTAAAVDSGTNQNRTETLVPALLFTLTFVMCCFPLRDFDFWWHLRTGELILERGTVPYTDWYTYIDSEQPWIDMHWGFQLLIVAVYRLTGITGIILAKAGFYTGALIVGWKATGHTLAAWQKALVWLPAMIAVTGRAYERPEMLSLLFLGVSLLLTEKVRVDKRWLWAWPVLMLIWANCHALFILGIVVWLTFAGEAVLARLPFVRRIATEQDWISLPFSEILLFSVLIFGAALVTPYTTEGLMFPLVLYRKFSVENDFYGIRVGEFNAPILFVKRMIQSHGPISGILQAAKNLYFTSEVIIFLIAAASFVRPLQRRMLSPYRLVLFAGFSHLAWAASRNTGIFSLVAATVACANFADTSSHASTATAVSQKHAASRNRFIILSMGLLMILFASGIWGRFVEKWKVPGLGEARNWFGHEAAEFCRRDGMPDRAYISHFGLAGVYIHHNGPERKVFMDPRLEVCTRQTFEKYELIAAGIASGSVGWEQIINPDQQAMPAIILDSRYSRAQINGLLQTPTWRMVFADQAAAVFVTTELASELALPAADPRIMFEIQD